MKDTQAYIERIRQLNADYQQLELSAVDASLHHLKPGQSLLARLTERDAEVERWDPYLRQRWWPVGVTAQGMLLIERPAHLRYEPQQFVELLGPIGQPYRFRKSLRNVLLIAYDTPPTPLAIMIPLLLRNQISITLVLLGDATRYQTGHLPPEIEVVRGNRELEWPDMVMTLGWADQVFVAVNPDDELNRFAEVLRLIESRRTDIPQNYLFGVFQPTLACGTGACQACTLRLQAGAKLACTDGPAFDLKQVVLR